MEYDKVTLIKTKKAMKLSRESNIEESKFCNHPWHFI